MIEATIFFTLLGLALWFFTIKTIYREAFMFLSCAIFLILGFMLYSNNGISFDIENHRLMTEYNGTIITNYITESSNQTYNLISGDTDYNINSKYLAVFFVVAGIITGLISFVMFTKTDNKT